MVLKSVRYLLFKILSAIQALAIRANYALVRRRIRNRSKGSRIRILFMVNEISKWKTQSLYDLMATSDKYEPIVGVTIADIDKYLSDIQQQEKINSTINFFKRRGMNVSSLYDPITKKIISVSEIDVDIVFYQQPYILINDHTPRIVSFSALTCYVPYYVTNYGTRQFDYGFEFHKQIWRYYILSDAFARTYHRLGWIEGYAGKIKGLGHTGLDYYYLNSLSVKDENIVIYAPHWSFDHKGNENLENYSTFLWSGKIILEYAKRHKEITWVFRPHPSLRIALERSGAWDKREIESYWSEWESFALISKNDDYQALFMRSKALITDCGSFLIEYFVTGKPIIHLISSTVKVQPIKAVKPCFDSWYQVHNKEELKDIFKVVIEDSQDPMKDLRIKILEQEGLAKNYAAEKILNDLNQELCVKI